MQKNSSKVDVNPSAVFDAVFDSGAAPTKEEDEVDPWPEVRLSPTVLGVEDGRKRAEELTRRGDFASASQMWAKVRFTAHRCRQPLCDDMLAEIEAAWAAAKEDVPPPPAPIPEPVEQPPDPLPPGSIGPSRLPPPSSKLSKRAAAPVPTSIDQATASADAKYDPTDWNHQFYAKMEKDYDNLCASDGWDDIRQRSRQLETSRLIMDDIPADSDYFRVVLPAGSDRELRCDPAISLAKPIPEVPRAPRRNLDELRRVEAETQAAMDKERARRAATGTARLAPQSHEDSEEDDRPPIRTKSDTVHVHSLDEDSDDEKERREELSEKELEVAATFRALEEFDKLGREKEERLMKWRERWG